MSNGVRLIDTIAATVKGNVQFAEARGAALWKP